MVEYDRCKGCQQWTEASRMHTFVSQGRYCQSCTDDMLGLKVKSYSWTPTILFKSKNPEATKHEVEKVIKLVKAVESVQG